MNTIDECPINFDIDVNYTTNRQYREILRKIFKMETQYYIENDLIYFKNGDILYCDDVDDETLDELNIDDSRTDICSQFIIEYMNKHPKLRELFEWSSAKVFSIDIEVGIIYLLSFHYLPRFYSLLCKVHNGQEITDNMIQEVKQIET